MKDIIQVYKSKEIFTKETYTSENRNQFHKLPDSITSKQGFLDNQSLVLPISSKNQPEIEGASLIIIQDINVYDSFLSNKQIENLALPRWFKKSRKEFLDFNNKNIYGLRQLTIPRPFEIFKIKKTDENTYELFIDYTGNYSKIGIPKRENHKIFNLKKSRPIRYRINGKSDFTLGGRKERTFYEFDYVIEWIGETDKLEFQELNKVSKTKIVNKSDIKLIDERKMLR